MWIMIINFFQRMLSLREEWDFEPEWMDAKAYNEVRK